MEKSWIYGTTTGRFPCKHINKSNTPKSKGYGWLTLISGAAIGLVSKIGDGGSVI